MKDSCTKRQKNCRIYISMCESIIIQEKELGSTIYVRFCFNRRGNVDLRKYRTKRRMAKAIGSFASSAIAFFFLFVVGLVFDAQMSRSFSQSLLGQSEQAQLIGFKIAGNGENVRLVLEVDGQVVPTGFLSGAPFRYAIDLPNVSSAIAERAYSGDPGFLKSIKYGRNDKSELRVIIGADVPFILKDSFILPKQQKQPSRLVFDFEKTSETRFRTAIARQAEEARLAQELEETKKQQQLEAAKRAQKQEAVRQTRRWRIVIDPGHGGKDGGAKTRKGVLEKNIVLSFSKRLAEALSGSGRFDVILTRTSDLFVPLKERVKIARDNSADLFISIHADSLPQDRRVRGTAIYTISSKASDAMAAELATQQNQSDAIAGYNVQDAPDEVVDILFDLTRRETSNLSTLFARHFLEDMKGKIRFFKIPLQKGAFTVLRVPDVPSALIELGFLSNNADADLLSSEKWRERVALEMAATIAAYFKVPLSGLGE